ncbi:DUF2169 family type VI secretion system accessory protein [Polyangium aurulentum]|uniref:DUF2169 family type VI secretion system accessory protein n=1 Tax=Polyangium aurulentum TaxID=2567896 RepID=UPI0010ADB7D6|nr:DUF2169 domain-containing protein [Polyangium aurulentum]UQA58490.1 DUF2169 domain-containing protein [Polyangium aurulentum]
MSFANETPHAALPVPLLDREGRDVIVTIVKATFAVASDGSLRRADVPGTVRVNDVMRAPDDPRSSALFPSDIALEKLGADVVVVGEAVSPRKVLVMDVAVGVKKRIVPLRVHGPRVYYDGVIGVAIGPAAPFERVPIAYENAYGGMSDDMSVVEGANPSGVGVAKSASDLVGRRAPQIEHPERPHTSAADRHAPVGYGSILSHWSPRKEHAGTFDDRWRAARMPLLPEDYEARFGNVAHPSLRFDEGLSPGDPVRVLGMSLEPFAFVLPAIPVAVRARYDGGEREIARPSIDTVIVLPGERRVELVFRAAFPTGRGQRILREIVVRNDA